MSTNGNGELCISLPTKISLEIEEGVKITPFRLTEAVKQYEVLRDQYAGRTGWELLTAFQTWLKEQYPNFADHFTVDNVDRLTEKLPEAYLSLKKKSVESTQTMYASLRPGA